MSTSALPLPTSGTFPINLAPSFLDHPNSVGGSTRKKKRTTDELVALRCELLPSAIVALAASPVPRDPYPQQGRRLAHIVADFGIHSFRCLQARFSHVEYAGRFRCR